MAKSKQQKSEELKVLEEKISQQKSVYFVDFQKLKAKDLFDLREKVKKAEGLLLVVKKSLAEIAFKKKNIPFSAKEMEGQAAIVFGNGDEISPARAIYSFGKEHEGPKILGGYFENQFISGEKVAELAQLPSRQELLARIVGNISSPLFNLHYALSSNIKGLVSLLQKVSEKQN